MHYGEYEGAAAATQQRKVLILGESHYSQDPAVKQGTPGNRGTCRVVEDYLTDKESRDRPLTRFFHNIVLAFGVNADKDGEKALFWDKVFFGNYIDVLCGVGDNAAKRLADANRDCYNQKLAEYVNQHKSTQFSVSLSCRIGIFRFLEAIGMVFSPMLKGESWSRYQLTKRENEMSICAVTSVNSCPACSTIL